MIAFDNNIVVIKTGRGYICHCLIGCKSDYYHILRGYRGYRLITKDDDRYEYLGSLDYITIDEYELLIGFK